MKILRVNKIIKIIGVALLVITSFVTWYISYTKGLATIYNDAASHLNIARAVIDNKQPGLAQLGSVWLPLNHILMLTLIWNNWAWHSGFAGSFFSMLAYIFSAIGIYKIVDELTDNFAASIIGAMAFALNLNILYLQTTPLTEPLYLVFFIFSALFLIQFIKTDNLRYLLLLGFFGMLQVLIRYDGWFVVAVEGLILIYHQKFVRGRRLQEIVGKFLIFALPVVFGATLWLLWNDLIFGSPLYFLFGPYSAHAQQVVIQNSVGLITKGNFRISLLAYWYAASSNVGTYLIFLAVLGAIAFFLTKKVTLNLQNKLLILLMLLSPIIFNVVALYLGFSILNLPQLHWDPSGDPAQQWFNVRYGIMALPLVAVFVGLLAEKAKSKWVIISIALVIVAQSILMYQQGIITITDGVSGTSNSMAYDEIGKLLGENMTPGQNILISTASYSSIIFKSNLPIKDFITEGDSNEWKPALANPQDYADWIVMGNENQDDSVYVNVYENDPVNFLKEYKLFSCNPKICLYEKRTPAEMYVSADGTNLDVGSSDFTMKGVNDYDLAYQSPAEIDATFQNLSEIGVNTVRFWMFGDGNPDGFQVSGGIMNESRLVNADYIIADASKYHIRLIPVLLNNWTDYGGMAQYLEWIGKAPTDENAFYTNPEAIALFENYINHIIPRVNTVNGISYNTDPTILAWEIINEPTPSEADSAAFVQWFSTITAYIRQEDSYHLITVDTEPGYVDSSGQSHVTDYCAVLPVNICSAHFYLYDGNKLVYPSIQDAENTINQEIQFAQAANKPFFVSELGVSKTTTPFNENPVKVLATLAETNSAHGVLVWNWSYKPDTSFGFSPYGTNGIYDLNDLSTVLGGANATTVYAAQSTVSGGGYDTSIPGLEAAASTTEVVTSPPLSSKQIAEIVSSAIPVVEPVPSATISPTILIPLSSTSTPSVASATVSVAPPPSTNELLPYSPISLDDGNWQGQWGTISTSGGVLNVGTDASDTSSEVLLNGSSAWTDYTFNATVNWISGQMFSMIARRSDGGDYLECDFVNDGPDMETANIDRIYNNQNQTISSGGTIENYGNAIKKSNMNFSMVVHGDSVLCGINNHFVKNDINYGMPPVLLTGGIGFKTWDPQAGNSKIIVNSVSVEPWN